MFPGLKIIRNPGISIIGKTVYPIILRDIAKSIEQGNRSGSIILKKSNDALEFGLWEIIDDQDDFDAAAKSNAEKSEAGTMNIVSKQPLSSAAPVNLLVGLTHLQTKDLMT